MKLESRAARSHFSSLRHRAEGDIIQTLEQQIENSLSLLRTIPSDKANFCYAPDKWSVKELLGYLIDSERIFSYRALSFARNDQTPLPG